MHCISRHLLILSLIAGSTSLWADVYKWTDDQGKVHFSNRPIDRVSAESNQGQAPEKVDIKVKTLTAEQEQAAEKKRRYYQQQLNQRQEQKPRTQRSSASSDSRKKNCRYYEDKAKGLRQKQKDLKLSGYYEGQKESLAAQVRDIQSRVSEYCR